MKLRMRSTKLGKLRFTSHRDAARMWERAVRRVGLPVAVSQGFTPRPKISFGLALPTGAESIAEYVDIDLSHDVSPAALHDLPRALTDVLPSGFDVLVVAEREPGSLQEMVTSCTWQLWSPMLDAERHRHACELLDQASLTIDRERKGKRSVDDVRQLILDLHVASTADGDRLVAELATNGRALRPSELARLAYPEVDPLDVRVLRTHQTINRDGVRREVLDVEFPLPHLADASSSKVLA